MVGTYQSWVGSNDGGGGTSSTSRSRQPYRGGSLAFYDAEQSAAGRPTSYQTASGVNSPQAQAHSGSSSSKPWWMAALQVAPQPSTTSATSAYSPARNPYASTLAGQAIANAQFGPQQVLANMSQSQLRAQLPKVGVDAARQTGILNRDTGLSRESLGLDRRALGVDRGLTQQQIGLQGEQYANQLRQLGLDEAQVRDLAERHIWDLRSNLTARGAYNTIANERGTGRIERDLGYQIGGIKNQRTGADISNRGTLAQLNANLTNLGIRGDRIGISDRQLTNSLNDGLAQIGFDSKASIDQINQAIQSGDVQQAQMGFQILAAAAQYANLPPEVLASFLEMLGVNAPSSQRRPTPESRGIL